MLVHGLIFRENSLNMTGDIYLMLTKEISGIHYIFTWGCKALQSDEYFGGCIVNDIQGKKLSNSY